MSSSICLCGGNDLPTFNGAAWTEIWPPIPGPGVISVSCPTTSSCAAPDNDGGMVIGRR